MIRIKQTGDSGRHTLVQHERCEQMFVQPQVHQTMKLYTPSWCWWKYSKVIMPRAWSVLLGVSLLATNLFAAVPWHHPLYLGNEGYWPQRVPVSFENPTAQVIAGEPVSVNVPALARTKIASLRVCRADGVELLFDIRDASGASKRDGLLVSEDTIVIPVECAAQSNTTVFIYAGNDAAWPVPD